MILQQAMPTVQSNLLRRVLLGNAIFSTLTALVFLLDAQRLAQLFGLGNGLVLTIIGGALLPFAALVAWTATRPAIDRKATLAILIADIGWVLGSVIILIGGQPALSSTGWWTVAILGDVVAIFAALEYVGLRQSKR
ncbi:MAG: hypothetical protein M3Q45_10965 [Chloroflexota bacterium]|nr:hypothetical protein [Chloroflexota bacterium]